MKTTICIAMAFVGVLTAQAQSQGSVGAVNQRNVPADTAYHVVASDAHENVWQREVYETGPHGQVVKHVLQYKELATGLNHLVGGKWVPSTENIEILPDGTGAATGGQQKAYFPGDIYEGTIRLVTPDGQTLQSRPIGLSYDDGTNTVLIAELTNSVGYVNGSNQVIYPDAFTGFKANLRYVYTKSGFEQDIILLQSPPTPESLGLNADTARLQVLTEFFSSPQPQIQTRTLGRLAGVDLTDQSLDFGAMQMVQGRAFLSGSSAKGAGALVGKHWVQVQGRQLLIEEVPVDAILEDLAALPLTAMHSSKPKPLRTATRQLVLPPQRLARNDTGRPMLLAKADVPTPGLVLDYVTVSGVQTSYIFRGDTTYYISGNTTLKGTNIIEGGAVIKFPASSSGGITLSSFPGAILVSTAAQYDMAVLTSVNDNSVGQPIGTGSPTVGAVNYLSFAQISTNVLNYLRFEYAGVAINVSSSVTVTTNAAPVRNCQFLHCGTVVQLMDSYNLFIQQFENVLVSQCGTLLKNGVSPVLASPGSGIELVGQNITVDQVNYLIETYSNDYCAFQSPLQNSILTAVTNQLYYHFTGTNYTVQTLSFINNGYVNSSSSGIYQAVGGGNYYLAASCPSGIRNAGTTSIDPMLLASLATKTTYPPVLYSNTVFSTATNFSPQAQRDTDTPDLGYHYDPIDYIVDKVSITNATLTVNSGTAIACYNEVGIQLQKGSAMVSTGTPLSPNWLVRYSSVQEQSVSLGGTNVSAGQMVSSPGAASAAFQFSKFACPAGGGYHLYDASTSTCTNLTVQNCEFWGGANDFSGTNVASVATLKNNLFWRSTLYASNTSVLAGLFLTNNLFWGTSVTLSQPGGGLWGAFNNDFDTCTITNSTLTNGYDAYLQCSGRLYPTNANDIISTNPLAYQSSWLGSFYQPASSPLINKGNATSDQVGLYHFTTQTNQVKETNSIVDIGYHYVATDAYGNPIDTDGDGVPDYLEDSNGNGIFDGGDLGDWLVSRFNGLSRTYGLQVFTPLK